MHTQKRKKHLKRANRGNERQLICAKEHKKERETIECVAKCKSQSDLQTSKVDSYFFCYCNTQFLHSNLEIVFDQQNYSKKRSQNGLRTV